ncbi:hypothetical protein [Dactylosporangium sp. CA-092794]|uniref:hypothetical protein n=1 Tax=Dactylosporangium sp. CA-092794 TaxID=3239929 RepID=UPI003D8B4E92
MRPLKILPLPQPCDWCRPGWLAWSAEIARQHEDNSIGQDARRFAQRHAHHIQTLCARLHQGVPYSQPYLCEYLDPDRGDGPVGCAADAADGSRFCPTHLATFPRRQAIGDDSNRAHPQHQPA